MNPLAPTLPGDSRKIRWAGLHGASEGLALASLANQHNTPILIITPDMPTLRRIAEELRFFKQTDLPQMRFPDWETLAYDQFSPHEDLVSQRLQTLYRLPTLNKGIVLCSITTLMQRLVPSEYITANSFILNLGDTLNLTQLTARLTQAGYQKVEQVLQHGEFAVRGSIIDLFPMGSHDPFRIELFDDSVETIRSFNADDQRSIEKVDSIYLLPGREYPLTDDAIATFRQNYRERFEGNPKDSAIYCSISDGEPIAGIEYYLPLFFEKTAQFSDYLPKKCCCVFMEDCFTAAETFWSEVNHRYEQLRYDTSRPICPPMDLFIPANQVMQSLNQFTSIQLQHKTDTDKKAINLTTEKSPNLRINAKQKQPLSKLNHYLNHYKGRVLFCAETNGRRETLLELFQQIDLFPHHYAHWQDFINDDKPYGITVAALDHGLKLDNPNITLITESQLFGDTVMQRRLRNRRQVDPDLLIRSLAELTVGSPVVHIDHGVARYQGLQMIETGDIAAEYLHLEFANNDKIYVPIANLHLISRYTGADNEHAPLSRLGTSQWQKAKDKAAKRIRDVAAELLKVYSEREASTGYAFKTPDNDYQLFANAFPFEETIDQLKAIDDVISDMTSKRCMDRLVCGDVGFGKTEVAMRAAFLAVQSNKQVAVLVPTTLLATQHGENFQDRFADWPVKIGVLSRLKTKKEQDSIIKQLNDGKIDIVIGTHKLLDTHIKYKDLGLLIVDEEHRFGVRQKERIKALRAHVDILTLTATPIPRTLNMAMSGTRDLSIIATPPAQRLSIKTFVHDDNNALIREAILRETMRGGQIYFLYNDIARIQAMKERLQEIAPDARIAIAHGQLPERQLEKIMSDFYHQKFNVLLCTTIIESGIDIPTANTIIIHRADRFGLAQLHQIRGRVGRSHHQAYAYLLVPDRKSISRDAKKRLEAITSLEDLGAGFNLATHDLEIRGAGELLGEEQSGHMQAIGFSLYMDMLESSVKALKAGETLDDDIPQKTTTDVDLHVTALIPNDYVPDVQLRLNLYKRLSDCTDEAALSKFKEELVDRFGTLPEETQRLLAMTRLKLQAMLLDISKIDIGKQYGYVEFSDKPSINPKIIIDLIQKHSKIYQLQGANRLRFKCKSTDINLKIKEAADLLVLLAEQ